MTTNVRRPKRAGITLLAEGKGGQLLAALRDVLGRPHTLKKISPDAAGCCERCERMRRDGFTCAACGFQGAPIVWACGCRSDAAMMLKMWVEVRNRVIAGEAVAYDSTGFGGEKGIYTVADLDGAIANSEARTRPEYRCDGDCSHMSRECPVCAAVAGAEDAEDRMAQHLAGILRDVRALLPGIVPINPKRRKAAKGHSNA